MLLNLIIFFVFIAAANLTSFYNTNQIYFTIFQNSKFKMSKNDQFVIKMKRQIRDHY